MQLEVMLKHLVDNVTSDYTLPPERDYAMRMLEALDALDCYTRAEAERCAIEQWLRYQRIVLAQKVRVITEEWMDDAIYHRTTISQEEWLQGRPVAHVDPKTGIVEDTELDDKLAARLVYSNFAGWFTLVRVDDQMVVKDSKRHFLKKSCTGARLTLRSSTTRRPQMWAVFSCLRVNILTFLHIAVQ